MSYRVDIDALRFQVAEAERELDRLLQRVDQRLLPMRRVRAAKPRATGDEGARLSEYAEALKEAVACAGRYLAPRPPPELAVPHRWSSVLGRFLAGPPVAHDEVVSVIQELDPALVVTARSNHGVAGRFQAAGVPISFRFCYRYRLTRGTIDPHARVGTITMAIGVPLAVPELLVRPRRWRHLLLEPLGLLPRRRIDDDELDSIFLLSLGAPHARALLDREVRGALLELARHEPPSLVLVDGAATLGWCSEATREPVRAASRLLAALHRAASLLSAV